MIRVDRPPEKIDIRWQVHERLFPKSPNLYAAVDPLIAQINTLIKNPNISNDEKWLFRTKNGKAPSITFLLYEDIVHNRKTAALVYDQAFSIHVFTLGQGVIVIPFGRMDEAIYYNYWATKRDSNKTPPYPKDVVSGYLEQDGEGFLLKSIFFKGWDCRKQYEAAIKFPGFSTKDYDTIYFLPNYSEDYRRQLIAEMLAKNKMLLPDKTHKQLLAYNPEKD